MNILEKLKTSLSNRNSINEITSYIDWNIFEKNPKLALIRALYSYGQLDFNDYILRYPDILLNGIDPIFHFVNYGINEGRIVNILSNVNDKQRHSLLQLNEILCNVNPDVLDMYKLNPTRNKFAVYTAIFGNYDSLHEPESVDPRIDYICFTNQDLQSDIFTIIKVLPLFNNDRLSARCLKVLSHIFLKNYSYTLWCDGSTKIRNINLYQLMIQSLLNYNIAVHEHFQRDCIYDEIIENFKQKKDSEQNLSKIKYFLKSNGYPSHLGLVETAQLFRRNCRRVDKFNTLWWRFIKDYTFRDQLSFNYVSYILREPYKKLSGTQWLDQNFKNYLHVKKLSLCSEPSLDIIILVHNNKEITKKSLDSLLSNISYTNFLVTIVDNASDIQTKEMLREYVNIYSNVKVLSNDNNESFSIANNKAFRSTSSEFVLFMNNDIEIIDKDIIRGLISEMLADEKVGAIGPVLLYPDYRIQSAGIDVTIENNTVKMPATEYKNYRHTRYVDAITGAFFLSKREILKRVNCFDEIYFYGQEDIDLCLKIQEIGLKIKFVSAYEAIHHESLTRTFNQSTLDNRDKMRKKWYKRITKFFKVNKTTHVNSKLTYINYDTLYKDICSFLPSFNINPDLIVGIPRSGMIPAYMIASVMNRQCLSLDEYLNGVLPLKGNRHLEPLNSDVLKILLVDDSFNLGNSLKQVMKLLPSRFRDRIVEYHFIAIYSSNILDLNIFNFPQFKSLSYIKEIMQPRIFQWNYKNHSIANQACYDLDGVLCVDPNEEENDDGTAYTRFILSAKPLYIPKYKIFAIVTSRLEKYRKDTEIWLANNNVLYDRLYMLNLSSKEERLKLNCHAKFKADIYSSLKNTSIFFESDNNQAKDIAKLTGKNVICVENDILYTCK